MTIYPDTSFYFSLYATDANSPRADAWRQANPHPLPFTAFHRVELRNALSLATFQKRLTPQEVQAAWRRWKTTWLREFSFRESGFGTELCGKRNALRNTRRRRSVAGASTLFMWRQPLFSDSVNSARSTPASLTWPAAWA